MMGLIEEQKDQQKIIKSLPRSKSANRRGGFVIDSTRDKSPSDRPQGMF